MIVSALVPPIFDITRGYYQAPAKPFRVQGALLDRRAKRRGAHEIVQELAASLVERHGPIVVAHGYAVVVVTLEKLKLVVGAGRGGSTMKR